MKLRDHLSRLLAVAAKSRMMPCVRECRDSVQFA